MRRASWLNVRTGLKKVEAYVYLVTGTALGELNHPNPLEPQKFKKRSRHFFPWTSTERSEGSKKQQSSSERKNVKQEKIK